MTEEIKKLSLEELCRSLELSEETVRLYIREGLVERAEGYGRRAYYTQRHIEQLLAVRKWREAGLSLESIGDLLQDFPVDHLFPSAKARKPGAMEAWTHVFICEGLELHIDPRRADLTPEGFKKLARGVLELYQRIKAWEKGQE